MIFSDCNNWYQLIGDILFAFSAVAHWQPKVGRQNSTTRNLSVSKRPSSSMDVEEIVNNYEFTLKKKRLVRKEGKYDNMFQYSPTIITLHL